MKEIGILVLSRCVVVVLFVFSMMLLVDYLNVLTRGKLTQLLSKRGWRQYLTASFLGSTPGCLGAFLTVYLYIRGIVTIGALTGCMIATSGDEAFVMLALFPGKALLLFGILFVLGILLGWITDKIIPFLKISTCRECPVEVLHKEEKVTFLPQRGSFHKREFFSPLRLTLISLFLLLFFLNLGGWLGPERWGFERIAFVSFLFFILYVLVTVPPHYLEEHIYRHLIQKHLWRVFLWTFFALLFVEIGLKYYHLQEFVTKHTMGILFTSALVGIIPESGPHMVFVMMFDKGLIPFSILLVSSIVQDGHGMLPLFSYTVKDSLLVKGLNLVFGLGIGFILLKLKI